jgi:hypothetical protein
VVVDVRRACSRFCRLCQVGRQGEYIYGIGGVFIIQQYHLGYYSAGTPFAENYLSALLCRLNTLVDHKVN